jgi:hypothetical protein
VIIHGTQTLESMYAALFVRKKFLKELPFVGRILGTRGTEPRAQDQIRGYNRGTVAVEQAASADTARGFSADAIRLMRQGEKSVSQLSQQEFTDAVNMLKRAGYPVEVDLDTAWAQFSVTRSRYEYIAYQLAYTLDVVPAPWSGGRKNKFDTMWPTSAVEIYEGKTKEDNPRDETP